MKILIIEGTDNTGKDSLIQKILEKYEIATIIHCSKPKKSDTVLAAAEQDNTYEHYANLINNKKFSNSNILIFNRSWIGEYVYGTLYRNRNKNEVLDMINSINNRLLRYNDIYYIQLLSTSSTLLKHNEDNKSLSAGKIELINKERLLFEEIFKHCNLIHKKLIYVNDGEKFRNKEDIFNEVINFIQD